MTGEQYYMNPRCITCNSELEKIGAIETCPQCGLPPFVPLRESVQEIPQGREINLVPAHYDKGVQPWDLERVMETSGDCFVDARRTDAIEYCFRNKGAMLEDLKKARHCLDAAIAQMEKKGMK